MPIYGYQCAACGHRYDHLQKISDPDPDTCPACGAKGALSRELSAPQFRLKGGGWYETDFKSDKDKKRNLADGGAEAPAAAPAPAATPAPAAAAAPAPAASTGS
jgi:putative FmdB family regulatory protein